MLMKREGRQGWRDRPAGPQRAQPQSLRGRDPVRQLGAVSHGENSSCRRRWYARRPDPRIPIPTKSCNYQAYRGPTPISRRPLHQRSLCKRDFWHDFVSAFLLRKLRSEPRPSWRSVPWNGSLDSNSSAVRLHSAQSRELRPLTVSSLLCKLSVSAQLTGGAGSQLKSLGTSLSGSHFF
jgi:hypothetical protein